MKGKLIPTKDGPALELTPKDDFEKKWLEDAFNDGLKLGCLTSNEGIVESLVLWLRVQNNPIQEQKEVK